MAVYAYLTCPSRTLFLGVGRRARDADGRFTVRAWQDSSDWLPDALFTVLDDCAGQPLGMVLDSEEAFDAILGTWTELDDDAAADLDPHYPAMSLATYLDGRVVSPATYHAPLRPGRPVSEAAGVVRSRGSGPDRVDHAFTRALRWEPTESLRREELGLGDREHTEITAQQAADVVTRILWKRLRPDG